MQGWRDRMEDAHLAVPSLSSSVSARKMGYRDQGWGDTAVFAVMDGHGGENVAHFCARHLPEEVARGSSQDVKRALRDAFHRMDEMLADPANLDELNSLSNDPSPKAFKKWQHVNPECIGCTAVVCCVRRDSIVVANAGDSRAVLCRNGEAVDMSEDHKPNLPSERARIRRAGGSIMEQRFGSHTQYRVNGNLNLSRSIGDLGYKQNVYLRPQDQIICSTPDVKHFRRQAGDEFLVLACDGVWDVLSSQEVVDYIRPQLGGLFDSESIYDEPPVRLSSIVEGLLDRCLSPDLAQTCGLGGDNMTMVLVVLAENPSSLPGDLWSGQAGQMLQASTWLCPYQ